MKRDITLYSMGLPTFVLLVIMPHFLVFSILASFAVCAVALLLILYIVFKYVDFSVYKKTLIPVWLLGLAADFIGVLYMFVLFLLFLYVDTNHGHHNTENMFQNILSQIYVFVTQSGMSSLLELVYIASGILLSAVLIYRFEKSFLTRKMDLSEEDCSSFALFLAVFTAPYTFLLPESLFY